MKILSILLIFSLILLPVPALAVDQEELLKRIDQLTKELDDLKKQVQELKESEAAKEEQHAAEVEAKAEEAAKPSPIEISGDYRFRYDYLTGNTADYFRFEDVLANMFGGPAPELQKSFRATNDSLLTNRLGINLKIRATEDIQVKARLLMYKIWGLQNSEPLTGENAFFADRFNLFDGNVAHVPSDSVVRVDTAYATWSNIAGYPVWFSIGRRPTTGGIPTNIRQNREHSGTAGTPGILVDYAFDGMTLGVMPSIEALPGSYAKFCYGKGFDSGYMTANNSLKDVQMIGVNGTAYGTDNLHVEAQWNRAIGIFAFPETSTNNIFGKNKNLGDIDQFGAVIMGKVNEVGPGDLNLFLSPALSWTHPNDQMVSVAGPGGTRVDVAGLMYDAPALGGEKKSRTGYAVYLGGRYDIAKTGTKVGLEYNYGSKYWITFAPAADDMWTSKLGVRGSVYETYIIQELLKQTPISKYGKAFFRVGYQYFDFDYTGSNNWVGAPKNISDLGNPANAQMFTPLKNAQDIYFTFDVIF